MFCVIYKFRVRPGSEAVFEASWHDLTEGIYRHRGSRGSRLHKNEQGQYIAYAQWPSEEQYKKDIPLPEELRQVARRMRDSCDAIDTVHTMTVVDDLLRPEAAEPVG
jgi:heme-degrading monooxygenase HmoA